MNHISPDGFYALAFFCGVVVGFGAFSVLISILQYRRRARRPRRYV